MAYNIAGSSGPSSMCDDKPVVACDRSQVLQAKRSFRGKNIDLKRSASPQPGHIQAADSLTCSIGRGRGRGRGRGNIACRTVMTVEPPGKRTVSFDEDTEKPTTYAGEREKESFKDASEFDVDFHTGGSSDKTPDEKNKLESNIKSLDRINKNDQRLAQFDKDNNKFANVLFQTVLRNPQHSGAKEKYMILLKYAEVFRFGEMFETALFWYEKINSHLYSYLSKNQKDIFNDNFKTLLELVIEESFDQKISQIKSQHIPENYELLMDVFQDKRAYDLLHLDMKAKIIAIASRIVISRCRVVTAEKLLEYMSHDELKANCQSYWQTRHPVWWVARFLWIAGAGVLHLQSKTEIKQMVKEAEDAAWSIPEKIWLDYSYRHIPQSYYQMKETYFGLYLGTSNPNDEEELRLHIQDIRKEYPRVCSSVERQKGMLANGIESLCNMLLRKERLDEVNDLIAELETMQQAGSGGVERLGTLMIKAERTRIEYQKAKKEARDAGELRSLRERVEQHIEVMKGKMYSRYYNSSVVSCLGKLYFELENWRGADEAFSKYKGYTSLCFRLHAISLGYLGEFQRASKIFHQLETRGGQEEALFKIYLEHAITLSKWIESGAPMPQDLVLQALNKCNIAVQEGEKNWDAPWNAIGHICDIQSRKCDQIFASVKHNLIEPINQCGNWDDAAATAFTIANSEKPDEVREQITRVGPRGYRGLLKK